VIRVDESHAGQTITGAVGETVELSLGEKPTTGHLWALLSGGAPVCSFLGSSFAPSTTRPGAGGTRRWSFRFDQTGDAEIALAYRRAWESSAAPVREFRLRVRGL
jgi:predicted secreted protein